MGGTINYYKNEEGKLFEGPKEWARRTGILQTRKNGGMLWEDVIADRIESWARYREEKIKEEIKINYEKILTGFNVGCAAAGTFIFLSAMENGINYELKTCGLKLLLSSLYGAVAKLSNTVREEILYETQQINVGEREN